MGIKSRLSDKELLSTIYNAAAEYSKLVDNSFLIIGKNKNSGFFWFQCNFERKHFMHLLGIKSKTLGAVEFYNRCISCIEGNGDGISISQYVDFSYGYGNMATLGFKAIGETSFPITLIPTSIDEFVSTKYKIAFVLRKNQKDEKYEKVYAEIKKGLFKEIYIDFPEELKALIDI